MSIAGHIQKCWLFRFKNSLIQSTQRTTLLTKFYSEFKFNDSAITWALYVACPSSNRVRYRYLIDRLCTQPSVCWEFVALSPLKLSPRNRHCSVEIVEVVHR